MMSTDNWHSSSDRPLASARGKIRSAPFLLLASFVFFGLGCTPREDDSRIDDLGIDTTPGSPAEQDSPARPSAAEPTTNAAEAADQSPAKDPPKPPQVELQVASRVQFEEFLAEQSGKVVLVDYWATWCGPCVRDFHHTVEIANKYADADLIVVSFCCDDSGNFAQAREFLTARNADSMQHFIGDAGISEVFADHKIGAGIPEYRLFDKSGQHRFTFQSDGEGDVEPREKIEVRIRELFDETL
jgi:thiol-disulfide isomerase/thioredoxin